MVQLTADSRMEFAERVMADVWRLMLRLVPRRDVRPVT
jgi:hypothetical protein